MNATVDNPVADLQRANAELQRQLDEALQRETAAAEVLAVINSSPGDLTPVFDAMLEKAMTLCDSAFGALALYEGDHYRTVALRGVPPEFAELLKRPVLVRPGHSPDRLRHGEDIVQIPDMSALPAAAGPGRRALLSAGARTTLWVGLRKDGAVLGFFSVYRTEVRAFTDKEIALLQNFAAQAIIAIENVRLFNELNQRTKNLQESLEYQTATSDVLKVISRSTFDIQPVLDTLVETAARLCTADQAVIFRRQGELYALSANFGFPAEYEAYWESVGALPADPESPLVGFRCIHEARPVHVHDVAAVPGYPEVATTQGKARTVLGVPLLREGEAIGNIVLARQRVEPFTERQIELVSTFADQAVIAIENARLITETREALDQQTATAEVLQVINSSPGDLAPVFDAMLEKAMRLCEAVFGGFFVPEGDRIRAAATRGLPKLLNDFVRQGFAVSPLTPITRRDAINHIADLTKEDLSERPGLAAAVELGGARTMLNIALHKDDLLLGIFSVFRQEVRPFSEKQIALLQNFAAQAVIAMENARLIGETREALDQQTATAEVLQVINASPGDLAPVFDAILEKAHSICGATHGSMVVRDGENFRGVAFHNYPQAFVEQLQQGFRISEHPVTRQLADGARFVHTPDIADISHPVAAAAAEIGGFRTCLFVPLRKEDDLLGLISAARQEIRPFTEKEIALFENFAAQAVIAMENARLLGEIRAARDAAEATLRDLRAAQANLIQAEKMASLGQLTAGIAHEIKNPLNFVNNFASLSVELLDELKETTAPAVAALGDDKRAEIDETMVMLTGNLEKIAEHGRRADGIVKSMLEHSRGVTGERREVDLNGLVEEALNLAYHGARAQDQSFNITLEHDYAPALKPIELAPQEMTRVFLNLFGNGFYAANKRVRESGDRAFRPTLTVATRDLGDAVEIKVRDNGTGIPPEIRDKLFQPFFTTKPTGEGTGLGLSISYDIVTQQHGGAIAVESEVGEFTEFTLRLPRGGAAQTGASQ